MEKTDVSRVETTILPVKNQDGFALVTVLCFSAILMAMMTMVLNTTMIETLMSGASTISKKALSAADSGVEYVKGTFILIGNSFPASTTSGNYTAQAHAALPPPLNQHLTFLNLSSLGNDPALLAGSGFSGKYVSSNSGGGALILQAYRGRVTSRSTVGTICKTVEFEGYNLAP